MTDLFDADALRRWCRMAADELEHPADQIDTLNVFPVADADTGSNMWLTMASVATCGDRHPRAARCSARLSTS